MVKFHDLKDNMNIFRLPSITEKDARRLNKYLHSYRYITSGDEEELELIEE